MALRRQLSPWLVTSFAAALLTTAAYCLVWAADPPASEASQDGGIELLDVPAVWKRAPRGSASGEDGTMWFRCQVEVPAAWRGREVTIFVEPVDDAREVLVGGKKVAAIGSFPPAFRSGLGGESRFPVPAGALKFGEPNTVALRVYREAARTGFNVAAPVLLAGDEAIRLEGKWQFVSGDDASFAVLKKGEAIDPQVVYSKTQPRDEVEQSLKKIPDGDAGPLSPAESLARFETPDDLEIELVLSEPTIGQPLSIKFDERGRLWLVEYLQYPNPAGLTMVSRDKFLRSVYDKVPPAPPNHFKGADRISIHEDTNGDGKYDKHKTFVDGLNIVSAMARGRGGVWVLNPPYLLFYPDRDGDDVPDGDPEVHLEGFGLEDSHSVVNNLRFGPDGWLYAAQGSTVTGAVRRPGQDDKQVQHSMGQLIWRYHPERRIYEIFAEGGGNTFGVEIDSKGRVYSGTNGGDSRGYHYVQGGYFRKGFGKHGELSNPYAFGYFDDMTHPKVPRFTHTYIIYQGGALPKEYDGRLFGVGPLQSHVLYSEITPETSTFQTKDLGVVVSTDDTWFRPVDIQAGPDGAIYVADFYEQRIDHASHYQGRVDKESGRVYRLKAKGAQPRKPFDDGELTSEELLKLLESDNKWTRQTALRLLGDRQDKSLRLRLRQAVLENGGQLALEYLWAAYQIGGFDDLLAKKSLEHDDPYVRAWTVRLLCDERRVSGEIGSQLAALAEKELNVEVRSQLACSAKRLPAGQSLPIVRNLLRHTDDVNDLHLPLLLWWAIEDKAVSDRDAVLAMFEDESLWREPIVEQVILERIMRRYAQAGSRKDLLSCARLLEQSPSADHTKKLMTGFELAFEGRPLTGVPEELVAALAKTGGVSLALRVRQKEKEAIAEALDLIADEKADRRQRTLYIGILGQIHEASAVPRLLDLLARSRDDDVRGTALTALQAFNDPQIAAAVARLHNEFPPDVRDIAQTLLVSRPAWALELLEAIDDGRIDAASVPLPVVRKILFHSDEKILALVEKHWGKLEGGTTEEARAKIAAYIQSLGAASGNPYDGKALFKESCGKCHTLFNEGGQIGPDLTAFKRDDLNVMMLNVVNPSAEIREGYENYVVVTEDGRVLSGFIADQDNNVVVVKGIDGQATVIPRDEIDQMKAIPRSLMPEGILDKFNEQQVRDLFAYLRATQPVN
ncbi:MAG: HEAT repeat domain-containing protein [Pirellulaceae bacterium]